MLSTAATLDIDAFTRAVWSPDDLPDRRLYGRLLESTRMLVDRLETATTTVPRRRRRGFQRLYRNRRIDADRFAAKATAFAMEVLRPEALAIVPHDTTEVDVHGPGVPADAGVLRAAQARGYLVHSALAYHPTTGRLLTWLDSYAWTRSGTMRHKDHKARRPQDRESVKWRRGIRRVDRAVRAAGLTVRLVHVFDAEGAIHENFAFARRDHHAVIARVAEDRRIREGTRALRTHLAAQPVATTWTTHVRRAPAKAACVAARRAAAVAARAEIAAAGDRAAADGRAKGLTPSDAQRRARRARLAVVRRVGDAAEAAVIARVQAACGARRVAVLEVRHAPVTLTPVDGRRPVRVHAITFLERDPPADVEPVAWTLLTTCTVTTGDDACQIGSWYHLRYGIEEVHKVWKTGLHMEDEPFDDIRSFRRFVAVAGPVATHLLRWRELARTTPTAPAAAHVEAAQLALLKEACRFHKIALPRRAWTIQDVIVRLAQLGGYERRRDSPPGWLVIWRGWRRLQEFGAIYSYAQSSAKTGSEKRCVPK